MPKNIKVGSRVQYSAAFLRSTGMYTGPVPFAKGTVTAIDGRFSQPLAVIDWDTPDVPERVLIPNLKIVGERELD